MKLIERYILKEFIVPVLYCLFTFVLLYLIFDLSGTLPDIMANDPAPTIVVRYFLSLAVSYLSWLIPASLLLGALYTMWQLSRNSEITAMRASGFSYRTILLPFIIVSTVMAIFTAANNEYISPSATRWAKQIKSNDFDNTRKVIRTSVGYRNSPANRYWSIDSIDLNNPHILNDVKITQERDDEKQTRSRQLSAHRIEYADGVWWAFNPEVTFFDSMGDRLPTNENQPKLPSLFPVYPNDPITPIPRDFVDSAGLDQTMLSIRDSRRFLITNPTASEKIRVGRLYDLHYQIAAPFACIIMTIFAIPAGIRTGRQGAMKGIFVALALFFSFYAVTQICMLLAKRGDIEPWLAAWFPNIAFFSFSSFQFARLR